MFAAMATPAAALAAAPDGATPRASGGVAVDFGGLSRRRPTAASPSRARARNNAASQEQPRPIEGVAAPLASLRVGSRGRPRCWRRLPVWAGEDARCHGEHARIGGGRDVARRALAGHAAVHSGACVDGITRYLCPIWQEEWSSPLAYNKWIRGKLLYQKAPERAEYFACPCRIDGQAITVHLELEEQVPTVLPPDVFKLGCDVEARAKPS